MRRRHRYALTALLLLALLLSGCGKEQSAENLTADNPVDEQNISAEEEHPSRDTSHFTIAENGKSDYTLIRPEEADPDELAAAQTVFTGFQDVYGIRLPFETDFVKPGEDPDAVLVGEILVGRTNRYYSGVYCENNL